MIGMRVNPNDNNNLCISFGLLSESLVQDASVFGVGCCCSYLMIHVRVDAVAAVMTSVVVPSVCVVLIVLTPA